MLPSNTAAADFFEESTDWYDQEHGGEDHEHDLAAEILAEQIRAEGLAVAGESVLDVGCGTGRALLKVKEEHPVLSLAGLEPSEAMRRCCAEKGLDAQGIVEGDALQMPFEDNSKTVVSAFGVLHHLPDPQKAIDEMARVASKMVFISDHNTYCWGSFSTIAAKSTLRKVFGRRLFSKILTKGRGYFDSEHDGIFYPFSILDHLGQLENYGQVSVVPTKAQRTGLFAGASHYAVVCLLYGEQD